MEHLRKQKQREYGRRYYEKNRFKCSDYTLNQSFPRAIKKINEIIPEKVSKFYERFPYEKYGDPEIIKKLRYRGVWEHKVEYLDCYSAASDAYMYSICQCAFRGYSHVEYYIKKMIGVGITCALNVARVDENICTENNLKQVRLDSLDKNDRW